MRQRKKTLSPRSRRAVANPDERTHVARAAAYAHAVAAGRIPACKWIKFAAERYLADVKAARSKSSPFYFDPAAAERVCRFVELLPHSKGEWAARGEKMRLEPWQSWFLVAVFGFLRRKDNTRRYRTAELVVPRKNGKSALAAGVGLYMLAADNEHGAEVYSGATTEKQAWEIFRPARLMAQKTPALLSHFGVTVNAQNLHILANGSRFAPLIGKPADGASPSCALIDEYHEHDTDVMLDTMQTGMGARRQPLLLITTTAGDNLAGPCYGAVLDARRMLENPSDTDDVFAALYGIDPEDDWGDEQTLRKANPNFGVSVGADFLLARQREALQNPRKAGVFRTKHLNEWVQSRAAYFDTRRWIESTDASLKIEDFAGQPCRIGVDLASTIDIAAVEIVFRHGEGFARFGRYYLPEATIELPENEHYRGWRDAGWITQTDGDMIDYLTIRDDLLDLAQRFQVVEVAFDPHQAMQMMAELGAEGLTCVEVRPLVMNFSPAMKKMDGLIRSRRIAHDGDPVMTWMLSNVVAKPDAKDNVYPRKERPENKIDGPVAHMMAQARFMAADDGLVRVGFLDV